MAHREPRRMSPEKAAKIKQLARDTELLQDEIAAIVGVNPGRVSEVLNFKRYAEVQPA